MSTTQSDFKEVSDLRARLDEAEAVLHAIQHGQVDAIVVKTPGGEAVYTLTGADRPYRAFLDVMHDGAFTIDGNGTILYANRAFAALVGESLESVLGTHIQRHLASVHVSDARHTVNAVDDYDLVTAGDEHLPVSVSATPLDIEGKSLVAGIVWDRSAERLTQRLRESEERLSIAREAAGLGIHDYDIQRNVITWDPHVRALWGVGPDEVVTHETFAAGLHPSDAAATHGAVLRAIDPSGDGVYAAEYRVIHRRDGQTRWIAATGRVSFADGRPVRLVGTVQDVSARKQAEARQAFLLGLSDALRSQAHPAAIQGEACRLMAEFLAVDRAYYVDVNEAAGTARVECDYARGDIPSLAGEHRLTDFAWSVAILRRGECHVVADTQSSVVVPPSERPASAALQIIACLGTPLIKDGRLVGALYVTASRVRDWTEHELALVRDVGERLWSAVETGRAQHALRVRNMQLELLARVSERLLTDSDVSRELMQSIGKDLADLIGTETFLHYRLADNSSSLVLTAHDGIPPGELRRFTNLPAGKFLCGQVANTRQPLIVEDLQRSEQQGSQSLRDIGAISYAEFPLATSGNLFGTFAFVSKRRMRLSGDDLRTIQTVCDQVASALARARLDREVRAGEERARLALDGAELGSWDVDLASGHAVWSRRHAELQGYSTTEPHTFDLWLMRVHPEDRTHVLACLEGARVSGNPFAIEYRFRTVSDDERWLAVYGRYSYDEAGHAVRVSGVSRDVTERVRAEHALKNAEKRFQRFVEAAPDLVWECDPRGLCSYHGPQWQEYTGQSLDASLGYGWLEMIHPDDRARIVEEWIAAQSDDIFATEYRLRHIDQGYRWMLARAKAIRGADGAHAGWCGTSTDIHDLRQAKAAVEESERRFRTMADQTPLVMWGTDASGAVEFVNQAYSTFFDATGDNGGADDWRLRAHADDVASTARFLDATVARQPFRATVRVRRADGAWRWITVMAHPRLAPDGAFTGMIAVSQDVTEQQRASELAREAARQKDEFIAVLAHELRNPLAPIRTSMGIFRNYEPTEPRLAKCRDIIDRQVRHMARLLDDLLDVSRLSRGELTLQRSTVRLKDVIADAFETVQPIMDDHRHSVIRPDVDPGLLLEGDATRLAQVLTNLLNNAAKYTEHGGTIAVAVEPGQEQVTISVRDSGIGLRPDTAERIFELFHQVADARHRAEGGLGIGLALSKRIVELHGGRIAVASDGPGRGSTFIVTLPVQTDAMSPVGRRPAALSPAFCPNGSWRVLVVDDNVDGADTLAMLLDMMGCDTRTVYDGETAIREAATFHPQLVLLDLGMPGLDGHAVCRRMKAEHGGSDLTVAAVTGWAQDDDRRRTRDSGFDVHLVKPVDPQVLMKLIRELPSGS